MNYYTFDTDGNYAGVTESEPKHSNWTSTPYVDSFTAPKWDGEKWYESGAFDMDTFITQLSVAFDAKFEVYWKSKGYFDLQDLNNHSVDIQSKYNVEALSLIRWANEQWELIVANINENSNVEEIINSLAPYQNG